MFVCARLAMGNSMSVVRSKRIRYGLDLAPVITRGFKQKTSGKQSEKALASDNKRSSDKHEGEAINKFIEMAEAAKNWKPPYTDEEFAAHEAIAKEFTRQNMKRTNMFNKDLATKAWLMHEALRSMPPALANNALIIDDTPPPPDRPWPFYDTPPIPGFDARDYEKGAAAEDGSKA